MLGLSIFLFIDQNCNLTIYDKPVYDDKINRKNPEISLPLMVYNSEIIPMKNFTHTHVRNGYS